MNANLSKNFGFRLISTVIVIIAVVVVSYSVFAVNRGRARARKELATKGTLLAHHLAFSSRIGVFAENRELLKDMAESVVGDPDVVMVAVYNAERKLLYRGEKPASQPSSGPGAETAPLPVSGENDPVFSDAGNTLEVREPVVFRSLPIDERQLYFDEKGGEGPERTIGYIRIVLTQESMNREIRSMVAKYTTVALLFIALSGAIVYLWVKRAVKPLETLTRQVRVMGMGGDVEPVPVESQDEIGRLAAAFNTMLDDRKSAEQALEKVLMDIHDGIGGITTNISLLTEVARKAPSPADVDKALATIGNLARDGMGEIRSLMYSLDREDLNWRTLTGELRNQGTKILEPHGIAFSLTAETAENLPNPGSRLCLHLFRIYREALMNIVKHSSASAVTVSLGVNQDRVVLEIRDNGKGCNQAALDNNGRGISHMKSRAAEMRGTIAIHCDGGLHITLEAPLSSKLPES